MTRTETMRGTLELLSDTIPKSDQNWASHPRTKVVLLMPRNHRPEHEAHPEKVSIARPAWSCFVRPREEADQISAAGIDPRETSFQFLDIAMEDLGRWVGPLVASGWSRVEISVEPAAGAAFFAETWPCFHHPSIPAPTRLPLPNPPTSIDAKCWIHTPTGEIEPAAISVLPPDDAVRAGTQVTESTVAVVSRNENIGTREIGPTEDSTMESKDIPGTLTADKTTMEAPEKAVDAAMPSEGSAGTTTDDDGASSEDTDEGPDGEELEGPPPESATEIELRQLIQLLHADGNEMAAIMANDSFLEVSERATIEGIDVWSMVVRITE